MLFLTAYFWFVLQDFRNLHLYCNYSGSNFGRFRPTGATRCTDIMKFVMEKESIKSLRFAKFCVDQSLFEDF